MVMVMVIMLTLVFAIIMIGILSLNVGRVKTGQSLVDSIKAEQLATGVMYRQMQQQMDQCQLCPTPGDCSSCPALGAENMDNHAFAISVNNQGASANPNLNNTNQYQFKVDF